jgi:hypothetical protein
VLMAELPIASGGLALKKQGLIFVKENQRIV